MMLTHLHVYQLEYFVSMCTPTYLVHEFEVTFPEASVLCSESVSNALKFGDVCFQLSGVVPGHLQVKVHRITLLMYTVKEINQ